VEGGESGEGVVLTQLGYENVGDVKEGSKEGGKVRDVEGFAGLKGLGGMGKGKRRGRREL